METQQKQKHNKKMLLIFSGCLFALIVIATSYILIVNDYVCLNAKKHIITAKQAKKLEPDCILVLGAKVDEDGSPEQLLIDRMSCGVSLYHAKVAPILLLSGDSRTADYDELTAMTKLAQEGGVPKRNIVADTYGYTTSESLYRAKEIYGLKKIVIVTQQYHLYRAIYIARSIGLEAYGVAAESSDDFFQTFRDFREVFARNKDYLLLKFRGVPTYTEERKYIFYDYTD